jgi:hypothetical protein
MSGGPADFDRELEGQLHKVLDPMVEGTIPLRHAPPRRGFLYRLVGGAGAALAAKTVTGIAIAALAAGAATEVVITHSLNPSTWAQQTLQVVEGKHSQPSGNQPASSPAAANTSIATPKPTGNGLPITVPSISPPALPKLTPLPTPSLPPIIKPVCGPIGDIAPGC